MFTFAYEQPARIAIPVKVKSLAVQPEETRRGEDARWGQVAADKMIERLKEENAQGRYEIVERAVLQRMLEEEDLQAAFGDPDQAARNRGKLTAVDAIVYVRTNTSTEARGATRTKPSVSGLASGSVSATTESYTRYLASANMSFKLVDIATGNTLASLAPRKSYDSDVDGPKSAMSMLIGGSPNVPATDVILDKLIEQGVEEFVATISPHSVRVSEKLADGKSAAVKSGNALSTSTFAKSLSSHAEMFSPMSLAVFLNSASLTLFVTLPPPNRSPV